MMQNNEGINNKTFIRILENYRLKLFGEGDIAFKNGQQKNCIAIGNNYLVNDENVLEQYNCIMELIEIYLDFSPINKGEIYDIPEISIDYKSKSKLNLLLKKDKAIRFAKNARKYEKVFSKTLKLHFPQQIYQLLYIDKNIPNLDFPAPELKTLAEDIYDYEYRLETYYKEKGINRKESQDKVWRSPYPHENINYKEFPDVVNEYFQSEYFLLANNYFRNDYRNLDIEDKKDEKRIYNIEKNYTIDNLVLQENDNFLISPLYQLATNSKKNKKIKYQLISKLVANENIYFPKNGDLFKSLEKYIDPQEIYDYFLYKNVKMPDLSTNLKFNDNLTSDFVEKTKKLKDYEEKKKKIEKKLSLMITKTAEYSAVLKELETIERKIDLETKELQSMYKNLNNDSFGGI